MAGPAVIDEIVQVFQIIESLGWAKQVQNNFKIIGGPLL